MTPDNKPADQEAANHAPYRHFDGMCWPVPCERTADIAHALVWGGNPDDEQRRLQLVAASVINAYAELIRLPQRERNRIVAELRKGPSARTTGA